MKVDIKATNLELTPAIHAYIQKKMDMAEKYLGKQDVIQCDFEVALTTHHHHKGQIFRAEVNLSIAKEYLRADRTSEDLYKAIDEVKDNLVDLINKHKEKRLSKRRLAKKEDA